MIKSIYLSLVLVMFGSLASAADYVVIANNGFSAGSISKKDLAALYTGDTTKWEGKSVDLCAFASSHPASTAFLSDVVGIDSAAFNRKWVEKELSGSGVVAPTAKNSTADAVAFVSSKAGGLCYIPASEAASVSGVKKLTVN